MDLDILSNNYMNRYYYIQLQEIQLQERQLHRYYFIDTIHDNIREHTIKRNMEEDTIHDNRTNIIRCYSMEQLQDLTIPMNH